MTEKNYYLVLDTETCGYIGAQLPYDIGWTICDKDGTVYKTRNFIVKEIFYGETKRMKSAYYANKLPKYYEEIESGLRTIATFAEILETLIADRLEHKNTIMTAHNANFDKKALENACVYILHDKFIMPSITEFYDTQKMAKDTICQMTSYKKFCIENNMLTATGRIPQNAQALFRFISKNASFDEAHTALEDTLIEKEILVKCLKMHKAMPKKIIMIY